VTQKLNFPLKIASLLCFDAHPPTPPPPFNRLRCTMYDFLVTNEPPQIIPISTPKPSPPHGSRGPPEGGCSISDFDCPDRHFFVCPLLPLLCAGPHWSVQREPFFRSASLKQIPFKPPFNLFFRTGRDSNCFAIPCVLPSSLRFSVVSPLSRCIRETPYYLSSPPVAAPFLWGPGKVILHMP